jgi:hypothetical protein
MGFPAALASSSSVLEEINNRFNERAAKLVLALHSLKPEDLFISTQSNRLLSCSHCPRLTRNN